MPEESPEFYEQAVSLIRTQEKVVGTSFLQRKLNIGYGRAQRLIAQMESEGNEGLITAPRWFQAQLGESRKLLRAAIARAEGPEPCAQ